MRIALGADHAGHKLKEKLAAYLRKFRRGLLVSDFGTDSEESCDYPDYALKVARAVSRGHADYGILACGSGIGMAMAANKVKGIRAAVARDERDAKMSRLHNNANILCFGGRRTSAKKAVKLAKIFISTRFEGGRHSRRIRKIAKLD